MENQQKEFTLLGHYHFHSKDKTKTYYVIQVLENIEDKEHSTNKAIMINIFTDIDTYKKILSKEVGEGLLVEIRCNLETGKINYKVVI